MSAPAIRTALESALNAMSPALQTAWQNMPFTPTNGTPYQRVTLLPATPDNPEMGGLTIEQGIFHVALVYPLDTGPGAAEARAQLIKQTFKRGTPFTSAGVTTTVTRTPSIKPAMNEPDRYVVPVHIPYHAQIAS